MSSTKRLQPVADIAKQNERNAAKRHGDVLREFQQQQSQLDELIQYRDQYLERLHSAGQAGLSIVQMRDYQSFIARLNHAIAQQKQQVLNGQQMQDESRQMLTQKQNRTRMIDKVVESRSRAEQQRTQRREQREMDDRSHEVSSL